MAVRLQRLGQVHPQHGVALEREVVALDLGPDLGAVLARGGDEVAEEEVVGVLVRVGVVPEANGQLVLVVQPLAVARQAVAGQDF
jgi:hypothetical protein